MSDTETILKRLAEVEGRTNGRLDQQDQEARTFRQEFYRTMTGDLRGEVGIVGRLDRIEQAALQEKESREAKRNWNLAIWGAVFATGVAEAWNWLTRK